MLKTLNSFIRQGAVTLVMLGSLVLVSACGATGSPIPSPTTDTAGNATPTTDTKGGMVLDKAGLVAALKLAGVNATSAGSVEQPFMSVPGEAFNAGNEAMQVFEYADEAAVESDASKIKPDGTIDGSSVSWMAQPHFYRSGRIIVIYIGTDQTVLTALSAAIGQPFATGANVSSPKLPLEGTPQP